MTRTAGRTARTDETGVSWQASGSGPGCGCGGHGQAAEGARAADVPVEEPVAQAGGPAQPYPARSADPAENAEAVTSVLEQEDALARGQSGAQGVGVVPGRRPGNQLGLRDVSAAPSGGCGCGSGHADHGQQAACGCGGH